MTIEEFHKALDVFEQDNKSRLNTLKILWECSFGQKMMPDNLERRMKQLYSPAIPQISLINEEQLVEKLPRRNNQHPTITKWQMRFEQILGEICQKIAIAVPHGPGRPALPIGDIIFAIILKTYLAISSRNVINELKRCREEGKIVFIPHHNGILTWQKNSKITDVLIDIVNQTNETLDIGDCTDTLPDNNHLCKIVCKNIKLLIEKEMA